MKKLLLILLILSSFYAKGDIHQIQLWNGYYQFLPSNNITVQLGDTVQWVPLDPPTMTHTITSDNIPNGAIPFDQIWQLPADTFFQYIPQVVGLYQYVCTPHIPFEMIGEFTVVNGPQTYVPDDNFEAYLEANGMGNGMGNDDSVLTANIDTVILLNVDSLNIADLSGIEAFTSLAELKCYDNQLTSLDLSNNTDLTLLDCQRNQLTSLNVSQNTVLVELLCNENQLTSLDVSQNTALTYLDFWNNQITSIDVSQNTDLTLLNFSNNQLTNIDITNNTSLTNFNCANNILNSLDISLNTALTTLYCYGNQLTSLSVNTNTALTFVDCCCNYITSLDFSNNMALTQLWCSMNLLTSLNVNGAAALNQLWCDDNQLINLDVRNGNNTLLDLVCMNNLNLTCISVDNAAWSTTNWTVSNGNIDPQHYFSNNCTPTSIQEHTTNKELLKVTDLLGRETKQTNQPLLYLYDDGTVEKTIVIE